MNIEKKISLRVRYNKEELQKIDVRRKKKKMSRSKYIRLTSLKQLPQEIPEINRQAWVDLSKLSNNINQYQKYINQNSLKNTLNQMPNLIEEATEQVKNLRNLLIEGYKKQK